MDKRKLHHRLKVLSRLKIWQLIVITVLAGFLTATALRFNNLGMIDRRSAVFAADETGDKKATAEALNELRKYVGSHMNTDLGKGVYLQASYNRARDAALSSATDTSNPNSAVYKQASIDCQSRFVGGVASFRNDYVQCVVERVAALSQGSDPLSSLQLPRADLYRYNFVSPIISLDFAGFLTLVTITLTVVTVGRIALAQVYRLLLKTKLSNLK